MKNKLTVLLQRIDFKDRRILGLTLLIIILPLILAVVGFHTILTNHASAGFATCGSTGVCVGGAPPAGTKATGENCGPIQGGVAQGICVEKDTSYTACPNNPGSNGYTQATAPNGTPTCPAEGSSCTDNSGRLWCKSIPDTCDANIDLSGTPIIPPFYKCGDLTKFACGGQTTDYTCPNTSTGNKQVCCDIQLMYVKDCTGQTDGTACVNTSSNQNGICTVGKCIVPKSNAGTTTNTPIPTATLTLTSTPTPTPTPTPVSCYVPGVSQCEFVGNICNENTKATDCPVNQKCCFVNSNPPTPTPAPACHGHCGWNNQSCSAQYPGTSQVDDGGFCETANPNYICCQ